MLMLSIQRTAAAAAFIAALTAGCARAGPMDIEAQVSGVSDYRFRGPSLSARRPVLQAEITASHSSGV